MGKDGGGFGEEGGLGVLGDEGHNDKPKTSTIWILIYSNIHHITNTKTNSTVL
jgi:hypothetical protein